MSTLAMHYNPFVIPDNVGMSDDAEHLTEQFEAIHKHMRKTVTVGEPLRNVYLALQETYEEGLAENWDAYGAKAISPRVYSQAVKFLALLPPVVPMPDISLDPDGEIAFDWLREPRRGFSISVGEKGELSYAGIFGRNRTHGTEIFQNDIPKIIMENLSRLYTED